MSEIKSMINIINVTSFILFAMVLMTGFCIVDADPDAMARPTRPKVFTSVDELRKYLELVRDYYSLTGKARYGKRADMIQTEIDNPAYIRRGNFFVDTIGDDVNDKEELTMKNKIMKQSSDPVIPEWLNKLKMLSIDHQGKSHEAQWI